MTAASRPLLSYVVITANRRKELLNCLASIVRQDYEPAEIVVVDNNSQDDSVQAVRREFPEARIIELDYNSGVTGGRNIGMKAASGDIIVCIDDDAEFKETSCAQHIVQEFLRDPKLGIIALRIIEARTGQAQRSAIPRRDKKDPREQTEVAYYCGAGHAIRKQVVDEVGYYPEHYFMVGEEQTLAWRALEADWKILYCPQIEILHHEIPAARPSGQRIYYYTRSHVWLPISYLPWPYAVCHASLWTVHMFKEALFSFQLGHFFRGWWDAIRGLPLVLKERRPISRKTVRKLKALSGRLYY